MNKEKMIEEISKKVGVSNEVATKINDILENNFIVGKTNKEKIISSFCKELNIPEDKADEMYNKVMKIIGKNIYNKIKKPFGK